MRTTCFLPLLTVAALALSGCFIGNSWGDGDFDCDDDGNCFSCTNCRKPRPVVDAGCEEGPSSCNTKSDCPADNACVHNECHAECANNDACHEGEFCLAGSCREVPPGSNPCADDADCDGCQQCVNEVCVAPCAKDLDCGQGQVCREGFCGAPQTTVDGGTLPTPDAGTSAGCTTNSQCGTGNVCVSGTCHLACTVNAECPDSQSCQSGACKPRPAPACGAGVTCGPNEDCVNGQCEKRCTADSHCMSGKSCQHSYCKPANVCAP